MIRVFYLSTPDQIAKTRAPTGKTEIPNSPKSIVELGFPVDPPAVNSSDAPSMAGTKQSRRVSWAPDENLCQARMFLSEEAPSQSRFGAQQSLQAKTSWLWHATDTDSDDSRPPGFEVPHAAYQFQKEISQIPLINWRCPFRIVLNPEWRVAAGEESREVVFQIQREHRVLEALYPRQSSIPSNPAVSTEVQDPHHDDLQTPLIPINPVEEEDVSEQSKMMSTSETSVQMQQPESSNTAGNVSSVATPNILPDIRFSSNQLQGNPIKPAHDEKPTASTVPGAEPDIMAAASAAFTAIMKSNEEGSLVDHDLLIKILGNPGLLEKLLSEAGAPKKTSEPVCPASSPPVPPLPRPVNVSSSFSTASTHIYPAPNTVPPLALYPRPSPLPAPEIVARSLANAPAVFPPVKDMNYYKSLIQQHGEEKQDTLDLKALRFPNHISYGNIEGISSPEKTGDGSKQRDIKPRIQKHCLYFNSPRGCYRGDSCLFLHEASCPPHMEQQMGTKRIKLDKGLAGRR